MPLFDCVTVCVCACAGSVYCMNNDPTIACWGTSHLQYVLLTACLMVPYYFATLELQSLVQVGTI